LTEQWTFPHLLGKLLYLEHAEMVQKWSNYKKAHFAQSIQATCH